MQFHRIATLLLAATSSLVQLATAQETASPKTAKDKPAEAASGSVENAVVKVFATVRHPDLQRPWTKQAPAEVTGSGVVIEGKRILSNAHVVLYASQVRVQANQAGDKLSATVEAIAPGIDLAVLKLEDESFFDTHPPLQRASTLPEIKDTVMAYGYPQGGESLSITKGIVSRVDFESYYYSVSGLRIQIDAAINSGNSGGPAVAGDKMIGLAFSRLGDADNIGYIIPCEEIDLFLQDIADSRYDGKPAMYDSLQTLENPILHPFLKLAKSVEGIIVHEPHSTNASYPLKEWDVITKIGDTPVDNQGMIKLRPNLRVRFQYLVQKLAKDGKVPLTVVRAGKEMQIELPTHSTYPTIVPGLHAAYPSYFVCGPLVFTTASSEFIGALTSGKNSWLEWLGRRSSPLVTRVSDKPEFPGERLVVVPCPFFPHKLAKGYDNPVSQVVKTVNGIAIQNLEHLVKVLRDSQEEYLVIAFDTRAGETLVFPRREMLASTEEILTDNGVRSQGSADTLAIWNAKPAGSK